MRSAVREVRPFKRVAGDRLRCMPIMRVRYQRRVRRPRELPSRVDHLAHERGVTVRSIQHDLRDRALALDRLTARFVIHCGGEAD